MAKDKLFNRTKESNGIKSDESRININKTRGIVTLGAAGFVPTLIMIKVYTRSLHNAPNCDASSKF